MSTVLWANHLLVDVVTSDESDKFALHRHLDKLDAICRDAGMPLLSSICDTTDLRFNMEDIELPDGVTSTTELMAKQGQWIAAARGVELLEKLLATVRQQKTRFGLLRNDHDAVVAELEESIAFARIAGAKKAQFNFCVVM
ncbi:MAG: hypothetical protein M3O62_01835 [Pseudomonadota bacterium]|nr:hypothetical protein [Pseudomonadota bacterium]